MPVRKPTGVKAERSKPHCRSCDMPMAGHTRDRKTRLWVCNGDAGVREPQSEGVQRLDIIEEWDPSTVVPKYPQEFIKAPSFTIPETGVYHRKNPNFVPRSLGPPTEIVSVDETASGPIPYIDKLGRFVAGVYAVNDENLQVLTEHVRNNGFYSEIAPRPKGLLGPNNWVVTGKNHLLVAKLRKELEEAFDSRALQKLLQIPPLILLGLGFLALISWVFVRASA